MMRWFTAAARKQAEDVMQTIALRLEECGLTMPSGEVKDRVLQGQ